MIGIREKLWFRFVEYKLCFNKVVDCIEESDLFDWVRYLNETLCFINHDVDYYSQLKTKNFYDILKDFTDKKPESKNYYPTEFSKIEEYYFGITDKYLSYKEAFFVDFICSSYSDFELYDRTIKKIEKDLFLLQFSLV